MAPTSAAITRLLRKAHAGDDKALAQVMEIVYDDLHQMARRQMRDQFATGLPGITLEPRALVSETFLRMVKQRARYDSRGHFFAIATRVMLRVLLDYHRRRAASKRAAGAIRVSLSGLAVGSASPELTQIPDFVEALRKLEKLDARTSEIVRMRLVWGLTLPEIARAIGVSQATIEREWRFGRRWLADAIREPRRGPGGGA